MPLEDISSVEFEIVGKVKGCYVGTFLSKYANQLGLVGYIRNSYRSSMVGVIQGQTKNLNMMKQYMEKIASPFARVERVEYKNEQTAISKVQYKDFKKL